MPAAPAVPAAPGAGAAGSGGLGVARDFRQTHGEEAFNELARFTFTEADADQSGSIDKSELRACLKRLGIRLTGQTAGILAHYDGDGSGQIEQAEFLQLISDLIDGTFETTVKAKVEAQMVQQQQAAATAAAGQQQALAAAQSQQAELQQLRVQNHALLAEVETLKKRCRAFQEAKEEAENSAQCTIQKLEMTIHALKSAPPPEPGAAPTARAPAAAVPIPTAADTGPQSSAGIAAEMMAAEEAARAARNGAAPPKKKGMFGRR